MKNIILATMIALSSAQAAVIDTNVSVEAAKTAIDVNTTKMADINVSKVDANVTKAGANTTSTKPVKTGKQYTVGERIVQVVVTPVFIAGAIVAVVITSPLILLDAIFGRKKKK